MNINKAIMLKSIMLVVLFIAVFTSFPNLAFVIIDGLMELVELRIKVDTWLIDLWRGLKS